jgi:hypothetical protein
MCLKMRKGLSLAQLTDERPFLMLIVRRVFTKEMMLKKQGYLCFFLCYTFGAIVPYMDSV